MRTIHWSFAMRATALVVALAFTIACTKTVSRPSVEKKDIAIDWSKLPTQVVTFNGLTLEGIVLKPGQLPMEESFKSLLRGDFTGVVGRFDFSFRSSSIPPGVLQDLYDEGYAPAYVRVANLGTEPVRLETRAFQIVDSRGEALPNVPADELPSKFSRLSAAETAKGVAITVVFIAILVLVIALGGSGNLPGGFHETKAELNATPMRVDDGLIRSGTLPPGEGREGILFFKIPKENVEWSTAKLATLSL